MYHMDIGLDVRAKLNHVIDRILQLLGPTIAEMSWGLKRYDRLLRAENLKSYYHPIKCIKVRNWIPRGRSA